MSGGPIADTVTISIGELRATARKALEGAGVPDGIDQDGAEASVWLQSRGLEGVEILARDLGAARRLSDALPKADGALIDMQGASAGLVGGLIVELAQSRAAAVEELITMHLRRCRSPIALASAMAAAGRQGWSSTLTLEGESRIIADADGVTIDPAFAINIEEDCDLTIVPPGQGFPALLAETMASPSDLEAFRAVTLEHGLVVPTAAWHEISQAAKLVLVAASHQSRSGAGSEVDDNA